MSIFQKFTRAKGAPSIFLYFPTQIDWLPFCLYFILRLILLSTSYWRASADYETCVCVRACEFLLEAVLQPNLSFRSSSELEESLPVQGENQAPPTTHPTPSSRLPTTTTTTATTTTTTTAKPTPAREYPALCPLRTAHTGPWSANRLRILCYVSQGIRVNDGTVQCKQTRD